MSASKVQALLSEALRLVGESEARAAAESGALRAELDRKCLAVPGGEVDARVLAYVADMRREIGFPHWSREERDMLRLSLKWFYQAFGLKVPGDLS